MHGPGHRAPVVDEPQCGPRLTKPPAEAQVGVVAGCVPHGLGALFAGFHGDHDGTVAVAETRLDGIADHVVVESSHSGLLFSAEAARQAVVFLQEGHFLHPQRPPPGTG